MDEQFKVKTEVFEGPLELLLNLIEKRKLFINEISLSGVTEDYIEYVKKLSDMPMSNIANFIIIAATLILIKSKSLLPGLPLTEDEESSIEDLEKRLVLLKIYKDAGELISKNLQGNANFVRPYSKQRDPIFMPDRNFTVQNIFLGIQSVISNLPKKEVVVPTVTVKKVVSIEEMIGNLTDRITSQIRISFKEFAGHRGEKIEKEKKVEIIVSFLAMLELVKQGIVDVIQDRHFEDISIETSTGNSTSS